MTDDELASRCLMALVPVQQTSTDRVVLRTANVVQWSVMFGVGLALMFLVWRG